MATERELKTMQEDRLFDLLMVIQGGKKLSEMYLQLMLERAQSGMTADEIDAVRERVSRAIKSAAK